MNTTKLYKLTLEQNIYRDEKYKAGYKKLIVLLNIKHINKKTFLYDNTSKTFHYI